LQFQGYGINMGGKQTDLFTDCPYTRSILLGCWLLRSPPGSPTLGPKLCQPFCCPFLTLGSEKQSSGWHVASLLRVKNHHQYSNSSEFLLSLKITLPLGTVAQCLAQTYLKGIFQMCPRIYCFQLLPFSHARNSTCSLTTHSIQCVLTQRQ
jgi:hypothetical protein